MYKLWKKFAIVFLGDYTNIVTLHILLSFGAKESQITFETHYKIYFQQSFNLLFFTTTVHHVTIFFLLILLFHPNKNTSLFNYSDSIEDLQFVGEDAEEETPKRTQLHIVAPWIDIDADYTQMQNWGKYLYYNNST